MRKGIVLSNSWEHIGAMLANTDDKEQASFFKGFTKEMFSWETSWAKYMQLSQVNKHLTTDEIELLSHLTYEGD